MQMEVELDVYSGRPNPRWRLNSRDAGAFRALTAGLPPATTTARPAFPEPGLGYRGFTVRDGGRVLRVAAGRLTEGTASRPDPARSLERWLLSRLPPSLDDLRPLVAAALGEERGG
ncbi:hypothetical protein [Streptomyces caatingaensis]|uniref:hypothetical protein n=1 Tax=Streptomyces caatingaensis TaxID=1678637 RepID=UPI0006727962|nr:hypothetical protein [Streptomyces caatingaensis]